jgi:allantoate deiminase
MELILDLTNGLGCLFIAICQWVDYLHMPRRRRLGFSRTVIARIDALARITSEPGATTRLSLSPEHKAAAALVVEWMRALGMATRIDSAGTVVGRLEGTSTNAKTLLLGSHIDSGRQSGRYNGALGVTVALAAIAELRRRSRALPFAVEVLAFGDATGMRFSQPMFGASALAGGLDPAGLLITDVDGIAHREALSAFGCDPGAIPTLVRDPLGLLGFIEVHIEQGPVLELERIPVGIVTAISGWELVRTRVVGRPGHAGTQQMHARRDALAAAAEMIVAIERLARDAPGLVATVGAIEVSPNVANAVPATVEFTIDVRSAVDGTRRNAHRAIERTIRTISRRRGVAAETALVSSDKAAACDQRLIRHLAEAVEHIGVTPFMLPTGSRHDGLALAKICPIGMLLVRNGASTGAGRDEMVRSEDIDIATSVMVRFLETFLSAAHPPI